MQHIRIPVELMAQLCQLAASAPAPYAQTHAMWKAVEQLQPEPAPQASPAPEEAE